MFQLNTPSGQAPTKKFFLKKEKLVPVTLNRLFSQLFQRKKETLLG